MEINEFKFTASEVEQSHANPSGFSKQPFLGKVEQWGTFGLGDFSSKQGIESSIDLTAPSNTVAPLPFSCNLQEKLDTTVIQLSKTESSFQLHKKERPDISNQFQKKPIQNLIFTKALDKTNSSVKPDPLYPI